MLHGIHHTAISTANLERSLAFYRDLLGFTVMSEGDGKRGSTPETASPASRIRPHEWQS